MFSDEERLPRKMPSFQDFRMRPLSYNPLDQTGKHAQDDATEHLNESYSSYPEPPRQTPASYASPVTYNFRTALTRLYNKLGIFALLALTVGNLVALAALSFLAYLWFADHNAGTWRYVIVGDRLLTVVSGISKILEVAIATVLSVCSAIIAAILLERNESRLADAAAISMARYHGGLPTLLLVIRKQLRLGPLKAPFLFAFVTLCILIFSSTITVLLNSDIGTLQLPDYPRTDTIAVSLNLTKLYATNNTWRLNHGTSWLKKPSIFPTFAQYSQAPDAIPGVVDTGVTLRSLMPYYLQPSRINMQTLTGKAAVFDIRVSCQAPILSNVNVSISTSGSSMIQLDSTFQPSKLVSGLFNHTLRASGNSDGTNDTQWDFPIPISCLVGGSRIATQYNESGYQQPWQSSICQLPNGWNAVKGVYEYSGGLSSVFQNYTSITEGPMASSPWESWKWGNAFMILNLTSGATDELVKKENTASEGSSDIKFVTDVRNEWTDLKHSDFVLSASLCYSSFGSADVPIRVTGQNPSVETNPRFNPDLGRWDFITIRSLWGQNRSQGKYFSRTLDRYKELTSQRTTWLAKSPIELAPFEPYMRSIANMWNYAPGMGGQTSFKMAKNNGNPMATHNGSISALMSPYEADQVNSPLGAAFIMPDPVVSDFFQDIVTTGGDVAFALQSLFFAMVANEFYNRIFLFDVKSPSVQNLFVARNAPVRAKGFIAVFVVTIFYVVMVVVVVCQFLRTCRYTLLGNASWRTLQQTLSPVTSEALSLSHDMNDDEVEASLKAQGKNRILVGFDRLGSDSVPTLIERGTARRGHWTS